MTRPAPAGFKPVLSFLPQAHEDTSKIPATLCKPQAAHGHRSMCLCLCLAVAQLWCQTRRAVLIPTGSPETCPGGAGDPHWSDQFSLHPWNTGGSLSRQHVTANVISSLMTNWGNSARLATGRQRICDFLIDKSWKSFPRYTSLAKPDAEQTQTHAGQPAMPVFTHKEPTQKHVT